MSDATQQSDKKSFKDTLNLPHTDFPIRPNQAVDDPALIKRWEDEKLFEKSFLHNKGNPKYILHDGPPYANGNIHLGHAYNKILKDITCKVRRMLGYQVPVTPGWDCHGLPIELKVTQEKPGLSRSELIKACRAYASGWIDVQRQSFKNLGVLMDWARPYITMSPSYESHTIEAFGKFWAQGFIERKNKTVPWCFHCQTVLAAAEIEYKDRKDPSVYALFKIEPADAHKFLGIDKEVSLVVWTTTPWTLPLNRAVLARAEADYVIIEIDGAYHVIGARVADALLAKMQKEKKVIKEFKGQALKGLRVHHPFVHIMVPVLFDDSVGMDDGTAFVHSAPGCGPIDYEIGVKNNLEIFSPLSADGRYTKGIEPAELEGMLITDGQIWVLKKLVERGTMLYKASINHSYPHCWRCHNGLMFRATPQWFFDLNKEGIKGRALDAIEHIEFMPKQGRSFLKATVESRWEWCLSRQRAWGTPIPALLCKSCDQAFISQELINKVVQGVSKEGIEYWQHASLNELAAGLTCPCGAQNFEKEMDILDVWFDAGVSHYAVLYHNPELSFPADIYLEGIDQHRGWFQSSLLTSLVLEHQASMKSIMTHGFTVDGKGQKMSKSIGNVVSPDDIIKKLGTDGLRLWVSSVDNEGDAVVSDVHMQNVAEVYRKIRNTARFLLSNINDFDITKDAIAPDKLLPIDYYALNQVYEINLKTIEHYLACDYTAVFHGLSQYAAVELSSFYLDIVKDRLYVAKKDGLERRSAQTVLWHILNTLTRLMAPIMSFTAELVSDHYQKDKKESIHLQTFVDVPQDFLPDGVSPKGGALLDTTRQLVVLKQWDVLKEIRSAILKAIEIEREKGLIKHSLEARVTLYVDMRAPQFEPVKDLVGTLERRGINFDAVLKELLIVSQVILAQAPIGLPESSLKGVSVLVEQAKGNKCPRCWQWDETDHPDHLCKRCQTIVVT